MSGVHCPGCGSETVRIKGTIPDNHMFAGKNVGSMPAVLAVCTTCHLGFRSPQPLKVRLGELYAGGSESAWSEPDDHARRDWNLAASWVARVGATRVLDVGCFDGGFLGLLPATIVKAGVEINPAAVERAAAAGIEIVANDLHDLESVDVEFDLVSAFDVIEHVNDPRAFLDGLLHVVRPGGHVAFATGNLASPTWRLMGSKYLYSWFLEHISFVSPRWIRREAPSLGYRVVSVERFSHNSAARFGFLAGLLKNAAYRLSPRLVDSLRARSQPGGVPAAPPGWTAARDHILVILQRNP